MGAVGQERKTAPPLAAQDGVSLGGHSGALRTAHHLRQPLPALGQIGVWDRIFEAVSRAYDGDLQMIDSSSIRVHQHGGNAKKGGPHGVGRRSTSLEPSAWGAREAD